MTHPPKCVFRQPGVGSSFVQKNIGTLPGMRQWNISRMASATVALAPVGVAVPPTPSAEPPNPYADACRAPSLPSCKVNSPTATRMPYHATESVITAFCKHREQISTCTITTPYNAPTCLVARCRTRQRNCIRDACLLHELYKRIFNMPLSNSITQDIIVLR